MYYFFSYLLDATRFMTFLPPKVSEPHHLGMEIKILVSKLTKINLSPPLILYPVNLMKRKGASHLEKAVK